MDELRKLIWERSRIFDLETGGLDPAQHPLIEGGVLNLKTGQLRQTVFSHGIRLDKALDVSKPGCIRFMEAAGFLQGHGQCQSSWNRVRPGKWQRLSKERFLERMSPWARAKFEPGQPWEPFLAKKGQAPAGWLRRNLTEAVSRGSWLWAHNARFDLRFLAANLTEAGYEELAGSFPATLLSEGTRRAGRLHITAGKETYRVLQQAREDPWRASRYFVQSWEPFTRTLKTAAKSKQGLMLDTQYVMQAALAHAQEAGLMRPTQDLFTGTSVEAYRTAFQKSFAGPAHTVAPDIQATAGLLDDYLGIIESVRKKQTLTGRQRMALRFHEELQPRLFPESARLQFLRAKGELLQNRPFEYYSAAGEQIYSWNFQRILDLYKQRQGIYGYGSNLEDIHREIGGLGLAEIEQQLASKDTRLQSIMAAAWKAAQKPQTRDFGLGRIRRFGTDRIINRIRTHPFTSFTVGVGAVMLGLAAFSGKDDDYNTIEGMKHGWFGEQRRLYTDFGSGYQGDDHSRGIIGSIWDWIKSHKLMWATIGTAAAIGVGIKRADLPLFKPLFARGEALGERILAAAPEATSEHWLPWIKEGVARKAVEVGRDIARHPVALGLGMGAAFIEEGLMSDERVRAKDVLEAAIIGSLDIADDLVYLGIARVLARTGLGQRITSNPVTAFLGQYMRAVGAAAAGYAVGKGAGLTFRGIRQIQKRRAKRELPDQAGLVQHLNKNKINHHRMNGY